MAIGAIVLSALATLIAFYNVESISFIIFPLIITAIVVWVGSVVWFLWGWLKNANLSGNERQGISSSSYILAFLPLCYCFLMVTDESRTRISVRITNGEQELYQVRIFGDGSIFLNQDTMYLDTMGKGEVRVFQVKASTGPGMRGNIVLEAENNGKPVRKILAGPFTINPMNIDTDWRVTLDEAFLK